MKCVILEKFFDEYEYDTGFNAYVEPFIFDSTDKAYNFIVNKIVPEVIDNSVDDFDEEEKEEERKCFSFDEHDMTLYYDSDWRCEYYIVPVDDYKED